MKPFPLHVLLLASVLPIGLPGQGDGDGEAPPHPVSQEEDWPEVDRSTVRKILQLARRLSAREEEDREKADRELRALGPVVVPYLLRRLRDPDPERTNDAVVRILNSATTPHHAALLAAEAEHDSAVGRRFVTGRLAVFHDPAVAGELRRATRDEDEVVAFHGALGLMALGDGTHLEVVLGRTAGHWNEVEDTIDRALTGRRDPDLSRALLAKLDQKDVPRFLAGLRLLRHVMPEEQAVLLRGFLDSSQSAIKKETINTLRVVVDGAEPLETLSVFQAIEMAKKWKERL